MMKNTLSRFLGVVERTGNRLPDPLTLFVILAVTVIVASWLAAMAGISVVHPGDGKTIAAQNLLTQTNLRRIITEMVKNFALFPPLGVVLVTMIGIGVAERSGLITTALKRLVTVVPKSALTPTLVFAGVMSNMAADAGYVVLTPLGAVLYAGIGKHPLVGLAAAFAGVSGGFSANLLLTSLDPLLGGLTTKAAQLVDPAYVVQASANYYFMIFSTFLVTIVGTLVTNKIVEPRLGKWKAPEGFEGVSGDLGAVSAKEKRALRYTGVAFMLSIVVIALLVVPQNAILRDEHGLKPFYESLVPIIMGVFFVCGVTYGLITGSIRSDKDIARMTADTMNTMGAYIVLAFLAAQFIAYFGWSNLGLIMAIKGAALLKSLNISGIPLLIAFILVTCFLNLFIGSASAKWAIMAPVFVPMLMLMGYTPELAQATYRVGDSVTNIISPLLPYFPIIIAFAKKYDPKAGIGTLIAAMLPYSIAFGVLWTIALGIWFALGLPLGPDAPLLLSTFVK